MGPTNAIYGNFETNPNTNHFGGFPVHKFEQRQTNSKMIEILLRNGYCCYNRGSSESRSSQDAKCQWA